MSKAQFLHKVKLEVQFRNEKAEKNAVKEVRGFQGLDKFYKDMKCKNDEKDQKWIVIANIDPDNVVKKVGEALYREIIEFIQKRTAVPEKGQEPKKDKKKMKETKEEEPAKSDDVDKLVSASEAYNPYK